MKITRRQLKKILMREFRDINISGNFGDDINVGNNIPPLPPVDDDSGGGPGPDWPLELLKRLKGKKGKGYKVFVRDDGTVPFKRQVYKDMPKKHVNITVDALEDGIVLAIGYAKNKNLTAAYAGTKYIQCQNAMHVNDIMRIISNINKTLQSKSSEDISADLNHLISSGAKDPEPIDQFDFLNSESFLIDYYARGNR